jgi:hypothetical protein
MLVPPLTACVLAGRSLDLSVAELLVPVIAQATLLLETKMGTLTLEARLVHLAPNVDH